MDDIDYSDQLNALRTEDPLCEKVPFQLFHCLSQDQLRLSLLLQSHLPSGIGFAYQIGFITNGDKPLVSSGFSSNAVSSNKYAAQMDCIFRGSWIVKIPQLGVDLKIGDGILRVTSYDHAMLTNIDRFRLLADDQIGFVCLMNRSFHQEGFPDGTLEIEVNKFHLAYNMLGDLPFVFWFDGHAPCSPGFKSLSKKNEMYGSIFSIGFNEVYLTNGGSLNLVEQGGEIFYIEIDKAPENKIHLVKYLNSRLGMPVSQITENLTDKTGPNWVVYSGSNLSDILEVFQELDRFGSSPRVFAG